MSTTAETLPFQAEASEVLGLMIHSLYKQREIFLRELVSNASDALDKRRHEALTDPSLAASEGSLGIEIEVDRAARTLSISDNGIGMSREELISHLGTIARSGTKAFLEQLKSTGAADAPELIGQFGVGFYSSFLVADRVDVLTRRAGSDEAWRWSSEGKGSFTVEPAERAAAGTSVILHLRADSDEEESGEQKQDWLADSTIRGIVERYSDFVAYPIAMEVEHWEPKAGGKSGEGQMVRGREVLNSQKPLWSRPKEEITKEEHAEFYRHLTHDWREPLETIHFKAEGTSEYTALLYIPSEKPFDLFEQRDGKAKLALYVKRVLIQAECEDLLPPWLRFVKGLVDASDLPLNVSRDVLQANGLVRQIKKRLTRRVVDTLSTMAEKERERFAGFFANFGGLLKEGIYLGDDEDGKLAKMLLFESTHDEKARTTLGEYVARMPKDQRSIYFLAGAERESLASSPHLEAFAKKHFEVLLMTDPVDEWLVQRLRDFEGKPLVAIDKGELELVSESEKQALEDLARTHRGLLDELEGVLKKDVSEVRFSSRLSDSPAVLVGAPGALSPQMERMLRAANQPVPEQKRVLELNLDHPLVARLIELQKSKPGSELTRDFTELLHGQALLAEGSPLPDGARFAKLVSKLMVERTAP